MEGKCVKCVCLMWDGMGLDEWVLNWEWELEWEYFVGGEVCVIPSDPRER